MFDLKKVWPEWEIEELIGQGAYGKVYRIRKERMGNVSYAALKIVEIPESDSEVLTLMSNGMDHLSIKSYFEETARGITNEIALLETLKSAPNIVIIEDYFLEEKTDTIGWRILIRMELLESLQRYQRRHGFPDVNEAVKIGIDLASALECCEERNIIHRDVKPENVFRNNFGIYKLGDFGIARRLENTTSAYSQKGTSLYMAPEVNRGEKYNKTVDIYSLGVMLYQSLNNQRLPFLPLDKKMLTPADFQKATERRLSGEIMPPPVNADEALSRIILKACDPEPAERYQHASELKTALQNWKEGIAEPVLETPAKIYKEPEVEVPIKQAKPVDPSREEQKVESNQKNQVSFEIVQQKKPKKNSRRKSKLGLIIGVVILACIIIYVGMISGRRLPVFYIALLAGIIICLIIMVDKYDMPEDHVMVWNDEVLEAKMRRITGISTGDILLSDVWKLNELNLDCEENEQDQEKKICDISALKELKNLTVLDLANNSIRDISAVLGLTNLKALGLGNNNISDISVVSELSNLEALVIEDNPIDDYSPLDKLPETCEVFK